MRFYRRYSHNAINYFRDTKLTNHLLSSHNVFSILCSVCTEKLHIGHLKYHNNFTLVNIYSRNKMYFSAIITFIYLVEMLNAYPNIFPSM